MAGISLREDVRRLAPVCVGRARRRDRRCRDGRARARPRQRDRRPRCDRRTARLNYTDAAGTLETERARRTITGRRLLAAGLLSLVRVVLGLLRLALGGRLRFLGFLLAEPQALERLADALATLEPVQDRLRGDVRVLGAQVVCYHVGGNELAVRELRVRLPRREVLSLEGVGGRAELLRDAAEPVNVLGPILIRRPVRVGRMRWCACMHRLLGSDGGGGR